MTRQLNYWVATQDAIAHWFITLTGQTLTLQKAFEFVRQIIDLGQQEQVLQLVNLDNLQQDLTETYLKYLRTEVENTGKLDFLNIPWDKGLVTSDGRIGVASKIVYYDIDGQIRETTVANLGQLLHHLRPDYPVPDSYLAPAPPLEVNSINKIDGTGEPIYFSLKLNTDLWFPQVLGLLEEADFDEEAQKLFDNSELASRHTPRLNRFIEELHRLTDEFGGEWESDEASGPGSQIYWNWCTVNGIKLE